MPGFDEAAMTSNAGLDNFAASACNLMRTMASTQRFADTRQNRVTRGYSVTEIAEIFGVDRGAIFTTLSHPDAPKGELHGRERQFSIPDVMRLRAMGHTPRRRQKCFWRRPGDRLPVIAVGSLKGGTGKSNVSGHLAQFAALAYGLRVGVIDSDAQSTLTLYLADKDLDFGNADTQDVTRFMGIPEVHPDARPIFHSGEELNRFWKSTPWTVFFIYTGCT